MSQPPSREAAGGASWHTTLRAAITQLAVSHSRFPVISNPDSNHALEELLKLNSVLVCHFGKLHPNPESRGAGYHFGICPQLEFLNPECNPHPCSFRERVRHLQEASSQAEIGSSAADWSNRPSGVNLYRIGALQSRMGAAIMRIAKRAIETGRR